MKAERKSRSSPGTSFIVGFVWLSLLFGLVSVLGCDMKSGGALLQKPGAADAIEYAEARQQAMKDTEVIEADRRYKRAYQKWREANQKLIEIGKRYGLYGEGSGYDGLPEYQQKFHEQRYLYGDELPGKGLSTGVFSSADARAWNFWLSLWTKERSEHDRLLDEYEELVDRKAREIMKASSAKAKRREAEPSGGAGGGGGHCFPADTFVFLNGQVKRITEVQIGDQVMSKDVATGKASPSAILKVYDFDADHYYLLNGKIKATGGESFYTPDGWKRTSDLKVGDRIHTLSGAAEEILSKERITADLRVYNIKVDRNHTFFVSPDGETGYLVHNK